MFRSITLLLLISLPSVHSLIIGRIVCDGKPVFYHKVYLMEKDGGDSHPFDNDDEVTFVKSDGDGEFFMVGYQHEWSGAVHYLSIESCTPGCFHHVPLPEFVPIVMYKVQPSYVHDVGTIEMSGQYCRKQRTRTDLGDKKKMITKEKKVLENEKKLVKDFRKIISGS